LKSWSSRLIISLDCLQVSHQSWKNTCKHTVKVKMFYLFCKKIKWKSYFIVMAKFSQKIILKVNTLMMPRMQNAPLWEEGCQVSISSTFLRTNFLYQCCFSRFYFVHATRKSCQNDVCTKNLYVKHWWNWHKKSKLQQRINIFNLWCR